MKRKHIILVHAVFWIYLLNQFLYPLYVGKEFNWDYLIYDVSYSMVISAFYFYSFYLTYPIYIRLRPRIFTILAILATIGLVSVCAAVIGHLMWTRVFNVEVKEPMAFIQMYYYSLRGMVISSAYALLITIAIDWFRTQKLKADLIMQNQASELALLRSQVNPHFLFNTLNNIYSLVYQKSEDAPAAVMKLSSIMRYMLYDANTDEVPLEKELEYLHSFVELQKLRFKQKDFVVYEMKGNPEGHTIAPMILIPFVENAFKHGVRTIDEPVIRITSDVTPDQYSFTVSNRYRRILSENKDAIGGIGLANIRRRLDLLYNGRYTLEINESEDQYIVSLQIHDKP